MLTESFIAATEAVNKPSSHLSSALKDVGIFQYEFQPQNIFRHGFKRTSVKPNCLAISQSHVFAAQANKAVINVYSREKGNQEAAIPFPDKIYSLAYAQKAAILIIGVEDGKLILWELATGRISTSATSHLEAITSLVVSANNDWIISGSSDSSIHIWSLPQLVGFAAMNRAYDDTTPRDAPVRTFASHRTGITALDVGHSMTSTNFAVSASADRTCYIWHIETCQILRTFLTIETPTSICLDPADRAVYLGNNDGSISSLSLFGTSPSRPKQSIYDITDATPIQLTSDDNWTMASSAPGSACCLTLSYDGTTLLSGHTGGSVIRWDVAKRRMVSELADLHQPVSCMQMLRPEGLAQSPPKFVVPTVVKPRLGLNAESTNNSAGLPASYSFTAQVMHSSPAVSLFKSNDIDTALAGGLFPETMLHEALQSMAAKHTGISNGASDTVATDERSNRYQIEVLQEEKQVLQKKLAAMQKLHYEAQERHRQRSERREKLGQQRREAYFAAKKKGKDGDAAMKSFDEKLEVIDIESDQEELKDGEEMEID